ncbi:MAG: ribonuclease H-like domain-containing protein [Planctomycetes bacterium]|nr:ribonuclease H-like domain-containing protein [Planctomycetota bacterium]
MAGRRESFLENELASFSLREPLLIEGEPNLDIDYLHGLLVAECGREPEYVAFLADRPEDEGDAFTRFVRAVAEILRRHPSAPIYHYHSYERTRVKKLFDRYPDQPIQRMT